jgi:Domain of unknown function (DUF5615)
MTASSLFIRLYLDEDVSVFVAQLLHPHGFDILTTREAQNLGYSDTAQLHFAATHRRTILTHANRRASDFELARRIMTVLNTFTAEETANQLLYL